MALAQKMQMRHSMAMTPQLQQAIKLLQFSSVQLAEYLNTQIECNPLLEKDEQDDETKNETPETTPTELSLDEQPAMAQTELDAPQEDLEPEKIPQQNTSQSSKHNEIDLEAFSGEDLSLRGMLGKQLLVAGLQGEKRLIAMTLIDAVDEDGFMRSDINEMAHQINVNPNDIHATLKICQGFEPTGIMARNLPECLALQLQEKNRLDPAMQTLLQHLNLLAQRNFKQLEKLCRVDQQDLRDMISEIQELNPRPGQSLAENAPPPIRPDILVRSIEGGTLAVELNPETLPHVLVNRSYYAEVSAQKLSDSDKAFISEKHADANWLVKSLEQRARTILKVAHEIVRMQDGFFTEGIRGMRPMTLKMVAKAVNMHESTISRVTSNKYMATKRGVFELKYFFTQAISGTKGNCAHAASAVREQIRSLIETERPDTIYSDDQIVEKLRASGIDIARRTVAKYREALRIPSSVQRRRKLLNP